jgi:rare lipoprotein A (peptidoglycan hydrolase)
MIVAHKTLPFGTLVEFEYGGRRAVAVVADRGPYVAGREFDLGPGVARTLGLNGVYTVQYRIVGR